MRYKVLAIALAATMSLGACMGPPAHHCGGPGYYAKQDTFGMRGRDLTRSDVRKVQKSLAAEGYYRGRIDGVWGPTTSQAILDYQTAHHGGGSEVRVGTLQDFGVRMKHDQARDRRYDRDDMCRDAHLNSVNR